MDDYMVTSTRKSSSGSFNPPLFNSEEGWLAAKRRSATLMTLHS